MKKDLEVREADSKQMAVRDTDDSAAVARARAETETALLVAMRMRRNEYDARGKMAEAVGRPKMAEVAVYAYPRGGREIFGPSINLAREMARVWGNIRTGLRVIYESDEERIIEAYAWDLETNTYVSAQDQFKKLIQRKDKHTGVTRWITPDERDLRELTNRRAAILKRNCILELMPRDFVDELVEEARATVKADGNQKPLPERRKDAVAAFEKMGIYRPDLEGYLGTELAEWSPEQIVELQGVYLAIRENAATREEYFGPAPTKQPAAPEGGLTLDGLKGATVETEDDPDPGPSLMEMRAQIVSALKDRFGGDGITEDARDKAVAAELKIKFKIKDILEADEVKVRAAYETVCGGE